MSQPRSIPYWTTSVFSSAVTDLVLIYESVTSSASVVRWLALHSWTLNSLTNELRLNESQSQSYVTTDGQPASLSWYKAPIWGLRPDLYYSYDNYGVFFLWGALSDERTGLTFLYASGPCQRNLSLVRAPWVSRPYFTVSHLRLPFSSPPTTHRVTMEVFDPASTRRWMNLLCTPAFIV
jgi:hypothetical protein